MSGRRAAGLALVLLLASSAGVVPPVAAAAETGAGADRVARRYAGLELSRAIDRLRADGLNVISSTRLVRRGMIVGEEPRPGDGPATLAQLLAPHGLACRPGPHGAWLVVAAPSPGAIAGTIVAAGSGRVLAGARVAVVVGGANVANGAAASDAAASNATASATSNAAGTFRIAGLQPGRHVIEVTLSAFRSRRVAVDVAEGRTTRAGIRLEPNVVTSEAVVVHGQAPLDERGAAPTLEVAPEALDARPNPGHDVFAVVAGLPGVAGSDQSAAINVQGGGNDEVQVLLDGVELYEPFHMRDRGGLFSIVDARAIGGVTEMESGFPAQYGGRMSGVVDLRTVAPTGGFGTEIDASTSDARVMSQGTIPRVGAEWFVSARHGYPVEVLERLGDVRDDEPRYQDLFAKARLAVDSRTTLSLNVLSAHDHVDRGSSEMSDGVGRATANDHHRYAWIGLEHSWSPSLVSRAHLIVGSLGRDWNGVSARSVAVDDRRQIGLVEFGVDTAANRGRHLVKWGAAARSLGAEYHYNAVAATSSTPLPVDGRSSELAPRGATAVAWVADRIRLTADLDLELGLRWERHDYLPSGASTIDPRINLARRLGQSTMLRVAWGRVHQPQRIDELQVEDGIDGFFAPERAEHRRIEIEHRFDEGPRLRAGAWDKRMSALRPRFENLFDPYAVFAETAIDRVRIDADVARARGLDLSLTDGGRGPFHWILAYTLSRAEERDRGVWTLRSWDQRHALSADLVVDRGDTWRFAVSSGWHSGRPTTALRVAPDSAPVLGPRNAERLPAYARVDVRVERRFPAAGLRLYLSLANVFDRNNTCCSEAVDLLDSLSDGVPGADSERHGLSRMLAAGLSWSF